MNARDGRLGYEITVFLSQRAVALVMDDIAMNHRVQVPSEYCDPLGRCGGGARAHPRKAAAARRQAGAQSGFGMGY